MVSPCFLPSLIIWMPNKTDSICTGMGEKLRRPALHAIKIYSRTKSTRIATPNTLTDFYTQFLPKKPNLCSIFLLGHPNPYHTKLYYRSVPCPNTLMDSVLFSMKACFIKLISHTQHFYIAELYPILPHYWGIPNIKTLLSYTLP